MVRMTVLASGSRGNCTVVTGGRTSVLVDAGVSCREILKRMQTAGEDPSKLDAILITHEHQDHVQGLSVLARRLGIPVYFTEATHRAWMRWMVPQRRMSYADWLAARKAEQQEKQGAGSREKGAAGEGFRVEGIEGSGGRAVAGEANPFYREAGLAECVEEQAELARAAGVQGAGLQGRQASASNAGGLNALTANSIPTNGRDALPEDASTNTAPPQAVSASAPTVNPCALPGVEYFVSGKAFAIGDLQVTAFTIPHDAADPVGFVVESEGLRIGLATDLGYMPANVSQQLRRCDVVMLEANHDLEMLRDGPYPWSVKQRVLSRVGHLSNAAAAEFLEKGYDGQAAYVVLAHLSESNNLPELARVAAEWALRDRMNLLANKLLVARQHEPTESICL